MPRYYTFRRWVGNGREGRLEQIIFEVKDDGSLCVMGHNLWGNYSLFETGEKNVGNVESKRAASLRKS